MVGEYLVQVFELFHKTYDQYIVDALDNNN
jgi:hypothetical protein